MSNFTIALNKIVAQALTMFYIVPISLDNNNNKENGSISDVPDYILQAIPFFIAFIILELMISKLRNLTLYSFKDTVMSISLGLVQQLASIWIKDLSIIPYVYVYNHFSAHRTLIGQTIKLSTGTMMANNVRTIESWQLFLIGFLAVDFCYYAFHRFSHEIHVVWATHSVHHSGEYVFN
jgi:sterol desaturase/sphingolipid hydroxylase (fatty acid hydroxylase superfamily)